jgi:hypothetical protein
MHKKWIWIGGLAALGYYFGSTPNDGTGISGIGGTLYGTIPTTLGLGTSPIVYAIEGAAFGAVLGHLIHRH